MATNGHSTPSRGSGLPTMQPSPAQSSPATQASAQEVLASNARRIIRAWPAGAALQPSVDAISHLGPIHSAFPSFFPAADGSDELAQAGLPADSQLAQFAPDFAALLASSGPAGHDDAAQWRADQAEAVLATEEMRQVLQGVAGDPEYGSLPPLRAPYLVDTSAQPAPSTDPTSLAAHFLSASSFPTPRPTSHPVPPSNPLQPRHLTSQAADSSAARSALEGLVRETSTRARNEAAQAAAMAAADAEARRRNSMDRSSSAMPLTPTHPRTSQLAGRPSQLVPTSSPDPLMMRSEDHEPSAQKTTTQYVRPEASQTGAANMFGTQILPNLPRKRSSSSDLSSHFSSPLKSTSPVKSERPTGDTTPMALEPGFESAVKRVKLESGKPVNNSTGGKAAGLEAVERFGDLVSDVFAADDAFIGDTSTAALSNRSPARSSKGPRFFRSTAVGATSGLPLVHTDTLKRMLALVRTITAKRKTEELLEEVEASGISRTLKLLERSWEGIASEGWEGWSKDAIQVREETMTVTNGKGKKGKKGAPAKGAAAGKGRAKTKGRKSAPPAEGGEDDDTEAGDDDDFAMATSSPLKATLRRSTRSPSPRPGSAVPPAAPDDSGWQDDAADKAYWNDDRLSQTRAALRDLTDALLAARLALELLTQSGIVLPKQLFSSEFLLGLIGTIRRALDGFFVPVLTTPRTSPVDELAVDHARDQVAEASDAVVQAVHVLAELVRHEELSEDLVLALSYLSLEPFFHDAPPVAGRGSSAASDVSPVTTAVKSLRLVALSVLQSVYARYTEQQTWIVEEVLGNLGKAELVSGSSATKKAKGGIRIRTGATVQTVSTLLMHLVQTCPVDLPIRVRKRFARAHRRDSVKTDLVDDDDVLMGREGASSRLVKDGDADDADADEDVLIAVQQRFVAPTVEAAHRTARTIVGFLMQRAAKAGKTNGVAADTEYRAVLDVLVVDLLATLHLPEWPGSSILLTTLCRSMMATLADSKTSHENNALKALALDHLGTVTAHIRRLIGESGDGLDSLRDIVARCDLDALNQVAEAYRAVLRHLEQERPGGVDEAVSRFRRLDFANEMLQALVAARLLAPSSEASSMILRLEELSEALWAVEPVGDVFGPGPEASQASVDKLSLKLWRTSTLATMYRALVERVLDTAESTQITLRTKAMRAIGNIVAQDPALFHQDFVRRGIESRLLDASSAVRDASVELIGKYVVNSPELARQYMPVICARIADSGLGVRRRVIKLLKVLFNVLEKESTRADICRKIVCRVLDEDEGIKELAVDTIEDLWFGSAKSGRLSNTEQLARIITLTCGSSDERPPPVDEALRLIMAKHAEKGTSAPVDRLQQVVDALVDDLVENKTADTDLVAGIKALHVVCAVETGLLSTAKATLLLPFLKSATTADERTITDYLLKLFRGTVQAGARTASKFGQELQKALVTMLNRPATSVSTLNDTIACFCATVHSQTQDYGTMMRVFKVTLLRLNSETQKLSAAETAAAVNQRTLPILCYMSALMCEHGRFDEVREQHEDATAIIDDLSTRSIAELTFDLLIRLYNLEVQPAIKGAVLTSLGFIFRAYPALMLRPASTSIIDAIFASDAVQPRLQILRIIQDFLSSQEQAQAAAAAYSNASKRGAKTATVEMSELVGNVEGFADSGVASAVSQRYLNRVNEAAMSEHLALQRVAVDLLSAIARSGFSHPITLSPTLAALTASPDAQLAGKAFSALAVLHQKHTSILATRFLDSARAVFAYVSAGTPAGQAVRGYRLNSEGVPESLLGRWYSLLQKEKRQIQLDCLKALGRAYDVEVDSDCSADAISFARFLAEALSTLEYKRVEEPLMVISQLNAGLAVSGLHVLNSLEQGLAGGGGLIARASASPQKPLGGRGTSPAEADNPPPADLARQSVVCGLALLLRDHLKQLYSLTDAKIAKYVPGKKSAAGDKAVTLRADATAALGSDGYARMPYALLPLTDAADFSAQRSIYLRLIAEDGTLAALDELEADGADAQDA